MLLRFNFEKRQKKIAFYRVVDRNVFVYRVLHGAMNYPLLYESLPVTEQDVRLTREWACNKMKNENMVKRSKNLQGYVFFVSKVREYERGGMKHPAPKPGHL